MSTKILLKRKDVCEMLSISEQTFIKMPLYRQGKPIIENGHKRWKLSMVEEFINQIK